MDWNTLGVPVTNMSWRLLKLLFIEEMIQYTISSTGIPIWPSLQTFPASVPFPISPVLLIRWPKYWSFTFSISPSNEYSELIFIRIDCFDLLAVQGTLMSFLQHRSSKASVLLLQHSTFFMVQLSHPYMTTGKIILWLDGPLSAKKCLCFLICS